MLMRLVLLSKHRALAKEPKYFFISNLENDAILMTMWKFLLLTFLALAKADVWDENSSGEPRRNYCCHVKCGVTEARRAEGAKRLKTFFFLLKEIHVRI